MAEGRKVWMNGNFVPEEEAKISIFDSALMFGDMVFEITGAMPPGSGTVSQWGPIVKWHTVRPGKTNLLLAWASRLKALRFPGAMPPGT